MKQVFSALIVFVLVTFAGQATGLRSNGLKAENGATISVRTSALKINVDDMDKALSFYVNKLGFDVEDRSAYPNQISLKTNERIKLILNRVKRLQKLDVDDTRIGLTLQVNDLDLAIEKMKAQGIEFAESERRKEAVGYAIFILDPFGRKISMMQETIVKNEPFKEPRIYNFGLLIPDMNLARDFYSNKLGFVVRSERYLPKDLPLGHKDKSFGFMLYYRDGVKPIKSEYPKAAPFYTIVFETDNLEAASDLLNSGRITVRRTLKKRDALDTIVFEDPFGNISELRRQPQS